MHIALRRADRHASDARDLLVREPEDVAKDDCEPLLGRESRERLGELAPQVGERRDTREIPVVSGDFGDEGERLGLPKPLAGEPVPARVDDEAVEPRGELRLATELAQARTELDERLLGGVTGLLDVADNLGGDSVHTRRIALDERVECSPVPVRRLRDEIHVAELPVGLGTPELDVLLLLTGGRSVGLHGGGSVALRTMSDSLAPEAVEPLLTGRFGRPYLYRESCESTQRLLDGESDEGGVAVCDEQTAGRGRLGRAWEAPAGTAILCSIALRPPAERAVPELSLVGGLAAAEAVERATGLAAQIKWPNDVMLNRRKVAGLLAEADGAGVILGIGINVNQRRDELPADANSPPASLFTVDGVLRKRAPILAELLAALERTYDLWRESGLDGVYDGLGSRDFLRGRRITVEGSRGYALAIDRRGRLEVDLDGERRLLESGEVLFER